MKNQLTLFACACSLMALLSSLSGCSDDAGDDDGSGGSGGLTGGTGGLGTGGAGTGGAGTGGATGGTASGGAGTGGATGGTSSGGGGGDALPPTFATVQLIFDYSNPQCASSDCHGSEEGDRLILSDPAIIYEELTTHVSEMCDGMTVVVPTQPEQSALYKIITEGCERTVTKMVDGVPMEVTETLRMPAGCFRNEFENNCLPDDQIEAIRQWIADGAQM